ncbi:MAG: HdeD family acid-resistance protein [Chloroflexi bacterium]|nr:HdeD family acid-resistance protein [Chloroflexota bacterium]
MATLMTSNWWSLLLRGLAAIVFGILVIAFPGAALSTFVILFAAYALVDGVFTIIAAIRNRQQERWWVHLLEGIVSVIAGILAIAYPGITALVMLYIIAFWAILTGVFEIWAAIQLRREIEGEFWLGLGGALSILFGVLLILFPGTGILTVLWLVAGYAIAFGVVMIILAFRLRGIQNQSGMRQTPAGA